VSAYVAEYGLTPGQRACEEKSNEITAIQDLMLQPWPRSLDAKRSSGIHDNLDEP
jgi:hypothetical protein